MRDLSVANSAMGADLFEGVTSPPPSYFVGPNNTLGVPSATKPQSRQISSMSSTTMDQSQYQTPMNYGSPNIPGGILQGNASFIEPVKQPSSSRGNPDSVKFLN